MVRSNEKKYLSFVLESRHEIEYTRTLPVNVDDNPITAYFHNSLLATPQFHITILTINNEAITSKRSKNTTVAHVWPHERFETRMHLSGSTTCCAAIPLDGWPIASTSRTSTVRAFFVLGLLASLFVCFFLMTLATAAMRGRVNASESFESLLSQQRHTLEQ